MRTQLRTPALVVCMLASGLIAQAQVLVRPDANTGQVFSITSAGDAIWLGAKNGAFRVDRATNHAVRISGDTGAVHSVLSTGDKIWLSTEKGIFRVDLANNQAVQLKTVKGTVPSIVPVGNLYWLRAFPLEMLSDGKETWVLPAVAAAIVKTIFPIGKEFWLVADGIVFRWDGSNSPVTITGLESVASVSSIIPVGDATWIGTEKGVFVVVGKSTHASLISPYRIRAMARVGDEVWMSIGNSVVRMNPNDWSSRWLVAPHFVEEIVPVGEEVWLRTHTGIFRADRKENQVMPSPVVTGDVQSIVPIGQDVWVGSLDGAWRVDLRAEIKAELEGPLPWSTALVGLPVWFAGNHHPIVHYIDKKTGTDKHEDSGATVIKIVVG